MKVSLEKEDDVSLVTVKGDVARKGAEQLAYYLDLLINNRVRKIILNLEETTSMSVAAWGLVLSRNRSLRDLGGRMLVAGIRESMNPVVPISHLRKHLECADSLPGARGLIKGPISPVNPPGTRLPRRR